MTQARLDILEFGLHLSAHRRDFRAKTFQMFNDDVLDVLHALSLLWE